MSDLVTIRIQHRYGDWRYGDTVTVPKHIADALCDSPSPNGLPFARRIDEPEPDLGELTSAELRAELEARDLSTKGKKSELLERLRSAL